MDNEARKKVQQKKRKAWAGSIFVEINVRRKCL